MDPHKPTPRKRLRTFLTQLKLPDDPTHPFQIASRTYALALLLSLGPALIPFVTALIRRKPNSKYNLQYVLRRDLGLNGFAFAITVAVGGGAALQHLWNTLEESADWPWDNAGTNSYLHQIKARISSLKFTSFQKSLISNVISSTAAIFLLQSRRAQIQKERWRTPAIPLTLPVSDVPANGKHKLSPTLDLTLLVLVRAVDSVIQSIVFRRSEWKPPLRFSNSELELDTLRDTLERQRGKREEGRKRRTWTARIDAFVFWACSARIMWCFFFMPQRLPASYVKWINNLAVLDPRLLTVVQLVRTKEWSYRTGSPLHSTLLEPLAAELGRPKSWGNPNLLPAYGGKAANKTWEALGVTNRRGVGGLPCELVHSGVADSCSANLLARIVRGFTKSILIYLPAHFIPILLTRPRVLLRTSQILTTFLAALRSSAFLTTFISSCWAAVCLTRSGLLAKYIFPSRISHDFWDGPQGCMMAASLVCGSSILLEAGKRRGEMALYVLPKAVRAWLPENWVAMSRSSRSVRVVEKLTFIVSLAWLLTAATHSPDSLRGLSRWSLAFIMKGPSAGFWKRKQQSPYPSVPPTPRNAERSRIGSEVG